MRALIVPLSVLLLTNVSAPVARAEAPPRPPNVLFIMTDEQRWDCVGVNGNALIKTPNLDRLAARGANFTHAFVAAPVCVPSRISFFSTARNRARISALSRVTSLPGVPNRWISVRLGGRQDAIFLARGYGLCFVGAQCL
jgi:hypothetical protein